MNAVLLVQQVSPPIAIFITLSSQNPFKQHAIELHYGDGCLIAYVAFSVYGPAQEQYAIDNGGASIIYQRDDHLEIESRDGRFLKICCATTSWFLDQIHVAGGTIQHSANVFRGDGGPVTMSDGTHALAHIAGIHWSTLHAIGRWTDEEARRRRRRGYRAVW